jgi:hypothetical protein
MVEAVPSQNRPVKLSDFRRICVENRQDSSTDEVLGRRSRCVYRKLRGEQGQKEAQQSDHRR